MKNTPLKIKYFVLGLCLLLFIGLDLGVGKKFIDFVTNNSLNLTGYLFLIHLSVFDFLVIASIPFFGLLYSSVKGN
ncbi:MAG: hypothetical protein JJU02_14550, partial [Cryomorphaceae bacterium]|nr:hypothetical protein [Cryomorphaceae bacterium]